MACLPSSYERYIKKTRSVRLACIISSTVSCCWFILIYSGFSYNMTNAKNQRRREYRQQQKKTYNKLIRVFLHIMTKEEKKRYTYFELHH